MTDFEIVISNFDFDFSVPFLFSICVILTHSIDCFCNFCLYPRVEKTTMDPIGSDGLPKLNIASSPPPCGMAVVT